MISSEVIENIEETPTVSTLKFNWDAEVKPGQFIMVWVPGVGEIPMSLSSVSEPMAITVKEYGETSRALRSMKRGDRLFFRGPYGNSFTEEKGEILLVGGGSGMASLINLFRKDAYAIISARTANELLFAEWFKEDHRFLVTDDGSAGLKGLPVDQLKSMDLGKFSMIYVCGPELMMFSVVDHLKEAGVKAQFSLERNMKCGIGICDSCSIDGLQLCKDGPVFSLEEVSLMEEFGTTRLTVSGKRVKI